MNRTVRVPRLLHVLHGEETTLGNLLFTWGVALATAVVVVLRAGTRPVATAWWEIAIVAAIGADIAGGVVASFTAGTERYYASRPRLRVVFLLLHVIQPTLLYFIIGGPPEVWAVVPGFAIVSALVVNALPGEHQQTLAAVLTVAGIMICFGWFVVAPPALWFGPLFTVKLVLGFAVRRS